MWSSILERVGLIPLYLIVATFGIALSCLLSLFAHKSISSLVFSFVTYGKTTNEEIEPWWIVKLISVPKRWFTHFYIVGFVSTLVWGQFLSTIFLERAKTSVTTATAFHLLFNQHGADKISWTAGCICIFLICLHVSRRLYESLFVYVYSDASMNFFHYAVGVVHYSILPLVIVAEMKGIYNADEAKFNPYDLKWSQWFGVFAFLFFNMKQHAMAIQLSNNRRDQRGLVRNYAYGVCYGGWFNYVSCPHFLAEILIYVSLFIVIPQAVVFKFVLLFVVVNQVFAAEFTHQWYKNTFVNYPPERKALIPFIF